MKKNMPISINNCLSHGICNCSCELCSVNKPSYTGPMEFQSLEINEALIQRIKEAAKQGIYVRHFGHSGAGEPTMHPQFAVIMDKYGEMANNWEADIPCPNLSVVTNGGFLYKKEILDTICRNKFSMSISLPTVEPLHYGKVMTGDSKQGEEMLETTLSGVDEALKMQGKGKLKNLYFHLSPPDREIIRNDAEKTIGHISSQAAIHKVKEINFLLFPSTANRSGKVKNRYVRIDRFRDLVKKYHGQVLNGVKINIDYSYKIFYPTLSEIIHIFKTFKYPCLWNASLFISAKGHSLCCNDQSHKYSFGDISEHSIKTLVQFKKEYTPDELCKPCNQKPKDLKGYWLLQLLKYFYYSA